MPSSAASVPDIKIVTTARTKVKRIVREDVVLYMLNLALYLRKIPCLYTVLYVEQGLLAIGTYHLAKPTGNKHWIN